VPPDQNNFYCPIKNCQYKSCRWCGEEAHDPLLCEEVEKPKETQARIQQEEALTQAWLRKCLKCSTPFYKEEWCNRMTCVCGTYICYVCRQLIDKGVKYAHFCSVPLCKHEKCGKCPLRSKGDK
jgi:TRIAD3 protein (E3 ubiquitin-protein ligase RNF216)